MTIIEPSRPARFLRRLHVGLNIILVIWGVWLIGHALPAGHKYEGAWIFAAAWLPVLLFATVEVVTMERLPRSFPVMLLTLLSPYGFVTVSLVLGRTIDLERFIVQAGLYQFSAATLALALQAAVLPILFKTYGGISEFVQGEVIPQAFGFVPGFIIAWLAFDYLLSTQTIDSRSVPVLLLGILQSAITTGLALHRLR